LIALLRAAGMPLGEIGSFLARPDAETLDAFAERLREELAGRVEVLSYVRQILKEEAMFEVRTKEMAPQRYRSRRECVAIEELEPFIVQTVQELGPAGGGPAFTVYHGAVNEHEDGPVEVCVPREDGDGELPAVEVAYTVAEGKQCDFPAILGAYDAVARWAHEAGRALSGPPRELYLNGPGEPLRMEIAWPLR
jgi:effector-binding domain-containing protein